MILGFHYHTPFVEKNGKYYVQSFIGLFLDTMAVHTTETRCFLHSALEHEIYLCDYELTATQIKIYSLGPHVSVIKRWLNQGRILKKYSDELNQCDKFLIRIPTPILKGFKKYFDKNKLVTYKVGDYLDGIRTIEGSLIRKILIGSWIYVYHFEELRVISNSKAATNSEEIFQRFKEKENIKVIKSTTLYKSSIYYHEDSFNSNRIILLYTGRFVLGKGIVEIMKAMKVLRAKGYDIVFHLVGWDPSKEQKSLNTIKEQMNVLGIQDYVTFFPKQPVGEALFKFYKEASIFLTCATGTEGFPRTAWEAMANGLPVIATTVGSVPYYLTNEENAVLIDPKQLDHLPEKIEFLINNVETRKKIIANAYKLVEDNTLESQSEKLMQYINE